MVVSASRSAPRLCAGSRPMRWWRSNLAALRRSSAVSCRGRQRRCKVTQTVSASWVRSRRLPLPPPSPRPSWAMPLSTRERRSGSGSGTPASRSFWEARRRCSGRLSPSSRSGAASCRCAIRASSSCAACSKRRPESRRMPLWMKAVRVMSLRAMPRDSRSCRAPLTPSALRPELLMSSSVVMPPSAGASSRAAVTFNNSLLRPWYSLARSSFSCASSMDWIRRADGKISVRFSSRLSRWLSSSQATAVFTRVSSVMASRSKALSSSSRRISPTVATTSFCICFLRLRLRSARRMP